MEEQKKQFMEEFKKAEGSKRLDMWDFACAQQVLWEKMMVEMQNIAREQNVDKKLDKLIDEEMKKAENEQVA